MTNPTNTPNPGPKQTRRAALRQEQAHRAARQKASRWLGIIAAITVIALVGFGLWSARPAAGETDQLAADFTLPTTAGDSVTLSDLRGGPVVIYFNEGAGCGSCTAQMAAIEDEPGFEEAGITVLPIVMNTADQITPDMAAFDVTTPYLLDDGTVSAEYGALGNGMHEGLPGHGFVLIDADGVQRWYGNYPSMWLDPAELLDQVNEVLAS